MDHDRVRQPELAEHVLRGRPRADRSLVQHRPWPKPGSRWLWSQRWRDLLFLHWPIDEDALRPLVPAALAIDRFDGQAWITAVPFRMEGVRPRGLPSLPGLSAFPELNLRTYVTCDGKPGVFFLRILAGRRMSAWLARRFSGLPYRFARMRFARADGRLDFELGRGDEFEVSYGIEKEGEMAARGTLDHWLLERYCLYCQQPDGRVERGEIDHEPWIYRTARFELSRRGLLDPFVKGAPVRAHASAGVTVHAWPFGAVG
ncbi:MAG: YqjF family protein [Polyangia bacterium]